MTEEKICPFMSRPINIGSVTNDPLTQNDWVLFEAICLKERCMMWEECRSIP